MMSTSRIAKATPFEGKPRINLPSVYGATPGKPFLLRIAATGERPIDFSVENLPEGLILDGTILSGRAPAEGRYEIVVTARNAKGSATKTITLEIGPDKILLTPLMGFTSWNAFGDTVTQEDITRMADRLVETGLADYGYAYVNTDSGWQGVYGGPFDAIQPNKKFPDIKKMVDHIHSRGLKAGIYSTPMLTAWGCPADMASIPGCTTGGADYRFAYVNGGIGVVHKEANNARQWAAWGLDYLKYDWSPTDPVNAEAMRLALRNTDRDFGFCVTVNALVEYGDYWSRYCQSYRHGTDSLGFWDNLLQIYRSVFDFLGWQNKGHYQDLDMLDIGSFRPVFVHHELTEDEMILAYSLRAFFASPIQISSMLEPLGEFEMSLYGNEEIIALNQDAGFSPVSLVLGDREDAFHVFEKKTEDGAFVYALFNVGETERACLLRFGEPCRPRDLWAREDLPETGALTLTIPPHTVRIVKAPVKAIAE